MSTTYSNKPLIFGYLKQFESNHTLYGIIPSSLYQLIFLYFPKRYNVYGIGKNEFDEFGLNERAPITRYTKLELFSAILCNPLDIENSYRTLIIRDYNNGLSYFGHINNSSSASSLNSYYLEKDDIYSAPKVISQGIMGKISVIASQQILTIYDHDKWSKEGPKQYINYIGTIFKAKIMKICCLMHEAIYLTVNGQIFYALHKASSAVHMMSVNDDPDHTLVPKHIPVITETLDNVFIADISCGSWHSLLLSNNGNVYGFGKNMFGQLGFGVNTEYVFIEKPMLHPFFDINTRFIRIYCGALFSMFITENGACFLCGDNDEGQIGNGVTKTDVKVPFALDRDIVGKVVDGNCGNKHCVVLNEKNNIWAMGDNEYGQCIPYLDDKCFNEAIQLYKADIGVEQHHIIERVITGVDTTLFIVCL